MDALTLVVQPFTRSEDALTFGSAIERVPGVYSPALVSTSGERAVFHVETPSIAELLQQLRRLPGFLPTITRVEADRIELEVERIGTEPEAAVSPPPAVEFAATAEPTPVAPSYAEPLPMVAEAAPAVEPAAVAAPEAAPEPAPPEWQQPIEPDAVARHRTEAAREPAAPEWQPIAGAAAAEIAALRADVARLRADVALLAQDVADLSAAQFDAAGNDGWYSSPPGDEPIPDPEAPYQVASPPSPPAFEPRFESASVAPPAPVAHHEEPVPPAFEPRFESTPVAPPAPVAHHDEAAPPAFEPRFESAPVAPPAPVAHHEEPAPPAFEPRFESTPVAPPTPVAHHDEPAPPAFEPRFESTPVAPPAPVAHHEEPAPPALEPRFESAPAAPPEEEGVVWTMPAPRPGPSTATGTLTSDRFTVIAYPFRGFQPLNAFQRSLKGLPGVIDAKVSRFFKGTLHLLVDYHDATPFTERLEQLGVTFRVVEIGNEWIELELADASAEGEPLALAQ